MSSELHLQTPFSLVYARCGRQEAQKERLNQPRRPLQQEAQLPLSDRAMRHVSSNLANYHATVQKILIRQVLTKPMV